MNETEISKMKRRIWQKIIKFLKKKDDEAIPSNVNNKWPEIILAERRMDKVIGRINDLIVSIITINGINNKGVFIGSIWAHVIVKNLLG